MKPLPTLLCLLTAIPLLHAQDWVSQLSSPDLATRRQAIDRIQTLDDPRIPEACLPLLSGEGFSIRRQAARAIGSRFQEIATERRAVFVTALREYEKSAPSEGDRIVAQRAIGLLTRDFSAPAFSTSPDGKWVLYEQRRLPVIADQALERPVMLRPIDLESDPDLMSGATRVEGGEIVWDANAPRDGLLKLMITNEPVEYLFGPVWQPKSLGLAIQPQIQHRFYSPTTLWRASDGEYRVFSVASFRGLYGTRFPNWSTCLEFERWDGSKAVFHLHDVDDGGGEPYDPEGIFVAVDLKDWAISLHRK